MAQVFNDTSIISIAQGFRLQWEEAQQSYVVLYPEGMVKLSGSAGEILKRADGETSVKEIIVNLEQQFETIGLADDVNKFLQVAYENGWIDVK